MDQVRVVYGRKTSQPQASPARPPPTLPFPKLDTPQTPRTPATFASRLPRSFPGSGVCSCDCLPEVCAHGCALVLQESPPARSSWDALVGHSLTPVSTLREISKLENNLPKSLAAQSINVRTVCADRTEFSLIFPFLLSASARTYR